MNALLAPSSGPGLTRTNAPANMNELLAPPSMPRRASTYHDTEKANSGELDNSGGSAAVPKNIERGYASISAPPTARWRGERRVSRRSTGKNRPLSLKPTLPRVLSRANASVVDEE